jgi:hypothetical protein
MSSSSSSSGGGVGGVGGARTNSAAGPNPPRSPGGEAALLRELRLGVGLASACERRVVASRAACEQAAARHAWAEADLEDALEAKASLCHQLASLLRRTEAEKYARLLDAVNASNAIGNARATANAKAGADNGGRGNLRNSHNA